LYSLPQFAANRNNLLQKKNPNIGKKYKRKGLTYYYFLLTNPNIIKETKLKKAAA